MSLFSKLFSGPRQDPQLEASRNNLIDIQRQLNDLMGQFNALNPNEVYTPTDAQNAILNNLANRTSARYAALGFGDSPLTGGAIASDVAPFLANFQQQAFQNKLTALGSKYDALGNYYNQLQNRYNMLNANRKQPWWQRTLGYIGPAAGTALGAAFGGPIGGAIGGAIGNSIYTPPQNTKGATVGGFNGVNPYTVNYPR